MPICREERTGGPLSADKITDNVTLFSQDGYNFYVVDASGKKFVIGGVPEKLCDTYVNEARSADGLIILTSKPEFCGGLERVLEINPDIPIYATPAGLRNIKEIVNREFNERLIKNTSEVSGIRFVVIPNVHWVDTVAAVYEGMLFSGELFSGGNSFAEYYSQRLAVNRGFVRDAVEMLHRENLSAICPSYGGIHSNPSFIIDEYIKMTEKPEKQGRKICVLYSSEYGFTKSMAEFISEKLSKDNEIYLINSENENSELVSNIINISDMLIVGTRTINRNAPTKIWDVITRIDLVNKRGMPYFVFGSFGWAGDGIKLVDKTLSAMGLRQMLKPVEVLLKPSPNDFERLEKAIYKILEYKD